MSDHKDLSAMDARVKIKEIAKGEIALFCTFADDGKMMMRPMATLDATDDGSLWFFSRDDSDKNFAFGANPHVEVLYAAHARSAYLAVDGDAIVSRDRAAIDRLWSPIAKTWFPEGKEDPHLVVVQVIPSEGHYWDTKNGKMISLVKIALAAVTGSADDDDGIEGALRP
ncbi:MAG TPA: pyridoxamine 5'-phosphate oxidase family protein [Myxococcota bacterium]